MSTYTPIASVTLSSAQSSVTFSGIPQTYTDLVVVVNGYLATQGYFQVQVGNGSIDTGSNYSHTRIVGYSGGVLSDRASNTTSLFEPTIGTSASGTCIMQFMNYSNSTTYKTGLQRESNGGSALAAEVGLWRSTSAINQIKIQGFSGANFASGTTFNLYGVANASITNVAKATGGDSVYTDGTYWYHIFRSSGTFTPTQALTADYLVVAGGAGGGSRQHGGGGGAGGMRCTVTATGGGGSLESALSLTAQAYTVTVGAGGAGGSGAGGNNNPGIQGSNSVFATITSTGGGAGGSFGVNGGNGGSGGGGGGDATLRTKGLGTANQGYDGGQFAASNGPGSGGGGAGAAGANASGTYASGTGGNGGNGVATSISGTSVTYAGGGGGGGTSGGVTSNNFGTGGTGGGGSGNGSSGTANTGSAGGGNSVTNSGEGNGGAGGSGIVIVRYAA